jgi:hypothetical protein
VYSRLICCIPFTLSSNRIPVRCVRGASDFTSGYPVRPDIGYPVNVDLIVFFKTFFLKISSGKEVCTEIILVTRNLFCFSFRKDFLFLKLVHKFIDILLEI